MSWRRDDAAVESSDAGRIRSPTAQIGVQVATLQLTDDEHVLHHILRSGNESLVK